MEAHIFEVDLTWSKERKGIISSPDIHFTATDGGKIEVATPPPFPKGMPGIWSPEHLFTASVSSCLMTTFLAIAENFKLTFQSFSCVAKGKLEQVEGKYLMTEVMLIPELTIFTEEDREKALKVLTKAEAACLISNSVKATVKMEAIIRIAGSL
ncbi:MAG: OsmC family peroxiredoxin [Cytophagia bacterium]|nr:OsmC family peroxiredoxin [Cytophagia bacterium]NBW34912.1 OsmC family peroxiredoxin [Cytophagia bacterium]